MPPKKTSTAKKRPAKKTTSRPRTRKPKAQTQNPEPEPQRQVEYEVVECPSCGGLSALRETCDHCKQMGVIKRPIRPGHETLSTLRQKMGGPNSPERNRYEGDGVHPHYTDPLWVGTGSPYK